MLESVETMPAPNERLRKGKGLQTCRAAWIGRGENLISNDKKKQSA